MKYSRAEGETRLDVSPNTRGRFRVPSKVIPDIFSHGRRQDGIYHRTVTDLGVRYDPTGSLPLRMPACGVMSQRIDKLVAKTRCT